MKTKNNSGKRANSRMLRYILPVILATSLTFISCTEGITTINSDFNSSDQEDIRSKKATPAGLVYNEFNRNYYKAVNNPGITWDEANAAIEGLSYKQCKGHLATITSQNENDWLVSTFPQASEGGYWLGGKQMSGATDPGDAWYWTTGENWIYTNWTNGEPNDFAGRDEESLHFSPTAFGAGDGTWNDQNNSDVGFTDEFGDFIFGVKGYVVEYDCGTKVTGSGNRNGNLPQISLVAQKDADNNVKGQAQVKYPKDAGAFHVNISCLSVWGNEAWIGGTVAQSSFAPFPTGTEILWAVADNGEGKSVEDFTSFYFYFPDGSPIADRCALHQEQIGSPIQFSSKGNIQIH